jgi:hypothetical protein
MVSVDRALIEQPAPDQLNNYFLDQYLSTSKKALDPVNHALQAKPLALWCTK